MLLTEAAADGRSTTGSNLRNIMVLAGKTSIAALNILDADKVEYHRIEDKEAWKIKLAIELVKAKANTKDIPGFNKEELDTILEYVCTQ